MGNPVSNDGLESAASLVIVGGDFRAVGSGDNGCPGGLMKNLSDAFSVCFVPCQIGFLEGYNICLDGLKCVCCSFPLYVVAVGWERVDIS